jgi:predicted metalloprotease
VEFDEGDVTDTSQIEDRRGSGFRLPGGRLGAGVGGGGILGVIALLFALLSGGGGGGIGGIDMGGLLNGIAPAAPANAPAPADIGQSCTGASSSTNDAQFIACVQNNVQSTWSKIFGDEGRTYTPAKLVLFSGSTQSACGPATSDTGPFYCPGDNDVYIDLGFFDELTSRFGAQGGDFAQAYVLAHEYGHHVQDLLGIEAQVRRQQQAHPNQANEYSVRLELQADCFAGVWGHSAFAQGKVSQDEIGQALDAAAAVGDDRIQKAATGRVNPESFTHGTSAQRQKWFTTGFESGQPDDCDTFGQGI